jgi:hypothetical protein
MNRDFLEEGFVFDSFYEKGPPIPEQDYFFQVIHPYVTK